MNAVINEKLREAATEGKTTITIPAMLTGRPLRYPRDRSARWIVEEIIEYITLYSGCSLTTVNIVVPGMLLGRVSFID